MPPRGGGAGGLFRFWGWPKCPGARHASTAPRAITCHDRPCESADILVGGVLPGFHCLEYREPVRRSQPFPLELEQVWCERFGVFLLPVGATRSHPKESWCT